MTTKSVADLAKIVDRRLKHDGVTSPGIRALTDLFEAVYLTSLRTEEGKPLQVRIVLVDPSDPDPDAPRPGYARPDRWKITKLAEQLPLTVPTLIKLSKAVDPWSSSLACYYDADDQFFVWGLVDQTVNFNTQLVRESDAGGYAPPGIFQVVAAGIADLSVYREFSFVARLQQDRLLKQQNNVFFFGPVMDRLSGGVENQIESVRQSLEKPLRKTIKNWDGNIADHRLSTLCRLLISIQRYRNGGAVLITNSRADLNIKYKINYARLPKALTRLWTSRIIANKATDVIGDFLDRDQDALPIWHYLDENVKEREVQDCKDEITGCVRFIASLSCVDGLVLATPDLTIRGFGVEIRTKKEIEAAYLAESAKARENTLRRIDPSHYGTRHRSMMRYCFAHPGSLGFVISQDGEIRAMTKVGGKLVMWENLEVFSFFESAKSEPKKKQEALASHASSSTPPPVASRN
jgi:hypothetical protein